MEHVEFTSGILYPYINFFLFVGLAVYFFRKPIAKMTLGRRESFEKLLQEAMQAKKEAESRLAELNSRLATLDNEVETIKNNAVEQAKRESDKIIGDANNLAAHLKQEAKSITEAELLRAKQSLKEEVLEVVRQNVEDRIIKEMDTTKQLEFIQNRTKTINEIHVRG